MSQKSECVRELQAEREEPITGPASQWITFDLGDEKYGINVMQVREVLRVPELAPVPGAPDFVMGIINLRGNVVTVVDARKRFGLPPRPIDDASRIVIIDSGGEVVGMIVDRVAEVLNLFDSDIESTPSVGNDESAKYLCGVSNVNGSLLILLDHDKFLGQPSSGAEDATGSP